MTQTNRILVAVVAAVAAAAAFWFLVLSPKREEAAKLADEITLQRAQLEKVRTELADFEKAKATYKTAYASVVRLGKAVPADDDVRSLMVQLDLAADRSGVDFRTIDVGKGANGAPPPSQTATTAPGTPAAGPSLPPGATVGEAGFPILPFSFTFNGSFFKLSTFFSRLERFVTLRNERLNVTGRLLTLDSLTLEPHQDGFPKIKASVGATSYLVSPLEGLTAGATPQGPAGANGSTATAPAPGSSTSAIPTTATSTGANR